MIREGYPVCLGLNQIHTAETNYKGVEDCSMKKAAVQNVSVGLSISNVSAGLRTIVRISGNSLVINMAHFLVFLAPLATIPL